MDKEINFLQNSAKKKSRQSARPKNRVDWTSPVPLAPDEEEKNPGKEIGRVFSRLISRIREKTDETKSKIKNSSRPLDIDLLRTEDKLLKKKEKFFEKISLIREEKPMAAIKENPKSESSKKGQKPNILPEKKYTEEKPLAAKLPTDRSGKASPGKADSAKSEKINQDEAGYGKLSQVWEEHGFIGTNLIRSNVSSREIRKKIIISSSLVLVALLLLPVAYYFLGLLAKGKVAERESLARAVEELVAEKKIKDASITESSIFKKRLEDAKLLLGRHVYFTNFFNFFEKNTLPNVYFTGFDGDNKGTYTLNAVAKDFKNITRQVEILRADPLVSEVSVAGGDYSSDSGQKGGTKEKEAGGVGFSLEIKLDKTIFNNSPE